MNHCNMCAPVESRRPGVLCDSCFETAIDMAAANRRRFAQLRAAGVSSKLANEILIGRIDGELPS